MGLFFFSSEFFLQIHRKPVLDVLSEIVLKRLCLSHVLPILKGKIPVKDFFLGGSDQQESKFFVATVKGCLL